MRTGTWQDKLAVCLIYLVLGLLAVIVVYPFIHVLSVSFSSRGRRCGAAFIGFRVKSPSMPIRKC
ncbi:hypothetical protein N6H14_17270 [Paenibacillus sp. CC-CFT747]|nr:hypothetical protein N6H14_17270 [Paenibacillus sp. CC-CFT747]